MIAGRAARHLRINLEAAADERKETDIFEYLDFCLSLCDKSDTLVHICKLLASGGSSVLLVDASEKRRYPYFIGGLGEKLCITEFA